MKSKTFLNALFSDHNYIKVQCILCMYMIFSVSITDLKLNKGETLAMW